jgi:hypothetical protein
MRSTTDSSAFQRQTKNAHLAFACLICLELSALAIGAEAIRWVLCLASACIFLAFAIQNETKEGQFWNKERNRFVGVILTFLLTLGLTLVLEDPMFIPLFAGLAITGMCHSRFEWELERQSKDLEALHAKLLRQEAQHTNERHFRLTK